MTSVLSVGRAHDASLNASTFGKASAKPLDNSIDAASPLNAGENNPCQKIIQTLDSFHERISGTLPIEENEITAFISTLENDLKSDPEFTEKLAELENDKVLLQAWEGKASWKNDLNRRPDKGEKFDDQRRNVVKITAETSDIAAAKHNIPYGKKGKVVNSKFQTQYWEDIGTQSKESDIDFAIRETENVGTLFQDNAIQGYKSDVARLIFRARFHETSSKLADTEFYPPHIGKYFTEELHDKTARAIYFRASLIALFLQQINLLKKEDFARFKSKLQETFKPPHMLGDVLDSILKEVEAVQGDIERMMLPLNQYPDVANCIFCSRLTSKMVEIAKYIDAYPIGSPNREKLMAIYYLYSCLRGLFLPQGYGSIGGYTVVCKDEGGQEHQTVDRLREEVVESGKDEKVDLPQPEKSFLKSTPHHLFESIFENVSYFFHRNDLIDASKYAKRVFDAALHLVNLISKNTSADSELKELNEFILPWHRIMSILEGTKRHKWDIYSYEMQAKESTRRKQEKKFLKVVKELGEKNNPIKASILKGDNPVVMVQSFVVEFPKILDVTDWITFDNFLTHTSKKSNAIAEFVVQLGKKAEDATQSWFKTGITTKDKEDLWNMLIKESQNRFEARIETKVKLAVEEAKKAYTQIQFGTATFEPQTAGKRATLAEMPLLGDLSGKQPEKPAESSGSSSSSIPVKKDAKPSSLRERRAAKMGKGLHMSSINAAAVAESVARTSRIVLPSGYKASDFAIIKQAAFSQKEIEKLKREYGISVDDNTESNVKLFEKVKEKMLDFQIRILDFACKRGIIEKPYAHRRIDIGIAELTLPDLELSCMLVDRS
jgi:hypothetical protein